MRYAKRNATTTFYFSLFSPAGPILKLSGVTDGQVTKTVWKDGVVQAVTVTVTEIGSGEYRASVVFPGAGLWKVELIPPTGDQLVQEDFEVVDFLPTELGGRAM